MDLCSTGEPSITNTFHIWGLSTFRLIQASILFVAFAALFLDPHPQSVRPAIRETFAGQPITGV